MGHDFGLLCASSSRKCGGHVLATRCCQNYDAELINTFSRHYCLRRFAAFLIVIAELPASTSGALALQAKKRRCRAARRRQTCLGQERRLVGEILLQDLT